MKLSVILLTWNADQFIRSCIDSLMIQLPEESEIIIIDNGSIDTSKQIIEQEYSTVTLICNEKNIGVGPARNQGLQMARGDYILVLDIDTIVQPLAIQALIKGMEDDPDVGLMGAKLVDPNGNLQYTCRNFPTLWSKLGRQLPSSIQDSLLKKEELRNWNHNKPRYVGYVIGACQMIRQKTMEEIGYYDDDIFYGPEDVDYCLRVWKAGWRVLYNPNAEIVHMERRIARKQPWRNRMFWVHVKGLFRYFWQHKYLFNAPEFDLMGLTKE